MDCGQEYSNYCNHLEGFCGCGCVGCGCSIIILIYEAMYIQSYSLLLIEKVVKWSCTSECCGLYCHG